MKIFDITEEDRVVLFIRHDANPFVVKSELCNLLKIIKCYVIVLKVKENKYLNVNK